MAYSNFTLSDLESKFGIKNKTSIIFKNILPIKPSEKLKFDLEEAFLMPLKSEKSRSEWIVVPILREMRRLNNNYFTIISGEILEADKKKGLTGECDFILAKDTESYDISIPIIQVVEAKKNDLEEGIRQCAAQMQGAKIFNENKGLKLNRIYGCSTTSDAWQFSVLENDILTIDKQKYYLSEIDELLGVFQTIINYYKENI